MSDHMLGYVLPFESSRASLLLAGGKGMNLADLSRAGFPVPPGFIVTVDAYAVFVQTNRLAERIIARVAQADAQNPASFEAASADISAWFEQGRMPSDVAHAIAQAYQELSTSSGALPVAVRSSATAEDLPGLSFAGQQETYLNVIGAEAVLAGVKRCWASLWTARAIGYRHRVHIPPDGVALAVVVQQMVLADVSGVAFTANPHTGRRSDIVIDASLGLGEAVVSGQVDPDHYIVDAPRGRILERKLGAKALAIAPRPEGGTQRVASSAEDAARPALSDARVAEVARLAGAVAEHYGVPQDIEWAYSGGRLHLLQARPITSLYPLPSVPPPGANEASITQPRVYFSLNSVQGMVEPFTPLGGDILRLLLCGFAQVWGGRSFDSRWMPEAGGRLYVDVTNIVGDPRLRAAYFAALSRVDPGAKQVIESLARDGAIATTRLALTRRMLGLAWGLKWMIPRVAGALLRPEAASDRALREVNRGLARLQSRVDRLDDLAGVLASIECDLPEVIRLVLRPLLAIVPPVFVFMAIVDRWLQAWIGEPPGSSMLLAHSASGNVTSHMNLELWAMAQAIGADPAARRFFRSQPAESLAQTYRQGALPAAAQQPLRQFMDAYGMRAVSEIDVGRPRWREDPSPILHTLLAYLQIDQPELAPDAMFRRTVNQAAELAHRLDGQVRLTRRGRWRARLLSAAIRRIQVLVAHRETPKFYLVKILGLYRDKLLEQGEALAAQGRLARSEDIFFVPLGVLSRAASGEQIDLRAVAAEERAVYERELLRRMMPRVLLSTGEAFYGGVSSVRADPDDLLGEAVSPGVVEGRARVVFDPRGVQLEPGDILVCPGTDPGWTPLFLAAGGLVTEIGGMITHGSVVAREYGIPAVVGVRGATERLKTGQRLRVDGNQGRVTIVTP